MCKPVLTVAVAALVATSCSRDGRPMTTADFCQDYSERECGDVAPACLEPEDDCLTARQAACTDRAQIEESAQRPFDPTNAGACLSRVSAVFGVLKQNLAITAKDYRSIETACARVFHGNAAANQACGVDADCSGTLMCNKGRCGTLRQVDPGAGCANIGEYCPQGYYCGVVSGVLVCTARPGLGAMCSPEVACLEDLRCDGGICADGLAIGVACQNDGDCASGFCEPFASKCGTDVRFANGTPACQAYQPTSYPP